MEQFVEYGVAGSEWTNKFRGMNLDPNAKNYSNCDVAGSFYEVEHRNNSFTAFGYEHDEKTAYVLVEPMTKESILNSTYLKLRTVPKGNYSNFLCPSDRYFDSTRFLSEGTRYRVLFKLDGTILVQDLDGDLTVLHMSK